MLHGPNDFKIKVYPFFGIHVADEMEHYLHALAQYKFYCVKDKIPEQICFRCNIFLSIFQFFFLIICN